jgi:hypothetical protein
VVTKTPSDFRWTRSSGLFAALVIYLSFGSAAWSYKQPTHRAMTQQAAKLSVLGSSPPFLTLLQCSDTAACTELYAQGILGQAAFDEDNGLRSFAHFFDAQNAGAPFSTTLSVLPTVPVLSPAQFALCIVFNTVTQAVTAGGGPSCASGVPLTMPISMESENWALGTTQSGNAQTSPVFQIPVPIAIPALSVYTVLNVPPTGCGPSLPPYVCDYAIAKADLLNAVSAQTPAARNSAASQLFQNIGHVLHHVQDMAQPQHVRNDPHCDSGVCTVLGALGVQGTGYAPSGYEEYVDGVVPTNIGAFANLATAGPQPLSVLPTPAFSSAADFWTTGAPSPFAFGRGMADFASNNFLSVGTSPSVTPGSLVATAPPNANVTADKNHPQPGSFLQQSLPNGCFAPNQAAALGAPYYVTGSIADPEGAGPASHGYDQSYSNAPLGVFSTALMAGATQWTVTQNCVTYDQAMFLLVPQAIRYSAWFIDYLFRGSISATVTSDGTLTITNASTSETVNPDGLGSFTLYSDDTNGNRTIVGTACKSTSAPTIGESAKGSCNVGTLGAAPPSKNYLLVYQGTLGSELSQVAFTSVKAPQKAAPSQPNLIDVQFSGIFSYCTTCAQTNPPQSGAAVVGKAGDIWNDFATTAVSGAPLVDTSGAATGVTLGFSSFGAYTADPSYDPFTGSPDANLVQGYLYSGGTISMTLSGLTPNQSYALYVYTQGDNNSPGRSISISANGGPAQTATQSNAHSFYPDNNYVLEFVSADGSGSIAIRGVTLAGEGDINGLQLKAEPWLGTWVGTTATCGWQPGDYNPEEWPFLSYVGPFTIKITSFDGTNFDIDMFEGDQPFDSATSTDEGKNSNTLFPLYGFPAFALTLSEGVMQLVSPYSCAVATLTRAN